MQDQVTEILWDDDIIWKLWKEHGVEWWEVEDVVFEDENAEARWHSSEEHGTRLLVRGVTRGGSRLFIVLRPLDLDEGLYRCATAYPD